MTPYFTHCTAFIHYPAEVIWELDEQFGYSVSVATSIEFRAEFGQLVHVGDTIVLDNSEGQLVADLPFVKYVSEVVSRNLTHLGERNYTDYLVTARQFAGDTIFMRIELQAPFGVDKFEF